MQRATRHGVVFTSEDRHRGCEHAHKLSRLITCDEAYVIDNQSVNE